MKRCGIALTACLFFSAVAVVLGGAWFNEDFTASKVEKKWMVTLYHADSTRPGAMPSTLLPQGGIGFGLLPTPDMAMLTTKHPSYNLKLLGNLSGRTVSAEIAVTGTGPSFIYYGAGGPAPGGFVRLYFRTLDQTLGESQYWWSNLAYEDLSTLFDSAGVATLVANLHPGLWSDRDGHLGEYDDAHRSAFAAAVYDVQEIGLSFGGGGLWAFGVGVSSGSATFQLKSFGIC